MMKTAFTKAEEAMVAARKTANWYPFKNKNIGTGGQNVLTGYIDHNEVKQDYRTYPCHAPIFQFKNATALWSAWGWREPKKAAEYYFNWLLTDSPWAKNGIVPKLDKQFMWDEGFVFDNLTETPANLLHNFLVATRMCAEWPEFINAWYQLVTDHKIDASLVYLFMTIFVPVTSNTSASNCWFGKKESIILHVDKYDWPLDMARAPEEYVTNFVTAKAVGKTGYGFSPSANTRPVNTLWGNLLTPDNKTTYVKQLYERYYKEFGKERSSSATSSVIGANSVSSQEKKLVFSSEAIIEIMELEEERLL